MMMIQFSQSNPTLSLIQVQHQEAIAQRTLLLASTLAATLVPSLEPSVMERDHGRGVSQEAVEQPQSNNNWIIYD